MQVHDLSFTGIQLPLGSEDESIEYMEKISGDVKGDVVVLPERFVLKSYDGFKESKMYTFLENFSRGRLLIAGSVMEIVDGKSFNRSYVFNDTKLLGTQDKIIPFASEKGVITGGRSISIFRSGSLTFSVAVCYDIDFPFFARLSGMNGADIIFNPSLIRQDFHSEWHQYIRARALENRISVISVNSITSGLGGDSIYAGTYQDGPGVRLNIQEASALKMFNVVHPTGLMAEKRKERMGEDPSSYSFPVNEVRY